MKTKVIGLDGKETKSIDLPAVFDSEYRPDLIKRAFTAKQSRGLQPHGADVTAGLRTSATYVGRRGAFRSGINRGMARLPRVKTGGGGLGAVKRVPHAVGGRRAHPPKVEKILKKAINKKEQKLAMQSAIGATTQLELVNERGHKIEGEVPIVVDDKFEALKKTSEVIVVLQKLGLTPDLERAKEKKVRAGKSKKRGKKYKRKKSALIVVTDDASLKACRNIPGVDAVKANKLNIDLLAPGAHAGRLTVWTEGAIKQVGEAYGN